MALALFFHDGANVLRLGGAKEAGVRQWFRANAAEFVAAAIDEGVAVGATAFCFCFNAAGEHRRVV